MSYLLYCIFHSIEVQRQATLQGVGGQPVFPVAINGISAAVSEISDGHSAPDIPRVMAYKKVIESFYSDRTVIPMRYGCVLRDGHQVIQLLKKNTLRYESLLKELDGCVEMGIRVLIDARPGATCFEHASTSVGSPCTSLDRRICAGRVRARDCRLKIEDLRNAEFGTRNSELDNTDPQSKIQNPKSKITGRAYLAARKDHYEQEERITEAKNKIAEQFRSALTGLFVKCKAETPSIFNRKSQIDNPKSPMLSLYFLVPGKSIDPFRRVFQHMRRRMETTKLLLSGPCPPYSFVLSDDEERRPGLQDEEAKER